MKSLDWPPNYKIKKSPRARYVRLKTSLRNGLELVVPRNFKEKEIYPLLEEHKHWIQKQLHKLYLQSQSIENAALPTEIIFPLIKQTWNLEYISSKTKLQIIPRPHQALVLLGNIEDKQYCKDLLIKWIKLQAARYLPVQLLEVSKLIKLPFGKTIVRDQTTRWGSCSSEKTISLNYKLLLLPAELAIHVMIHELCHTVHLDHSEKFWKLVESFDPAWEVHRKTLKNAETLIPSWMR